MRFFFQQYSKRIWFLFKIGLVLIFAIALNLQLRGWHAIPGLWEASHKLVCCLTFPKFLLLTGLVCLNIMMEASKWRTLGSLYARVSFPAAVKDILRGWAVGIFTPQRIGEYAGRILSIPKERRKEGIYFVFLGSVAQNLTHLLGVVPILYWEVMKNWQPIWIIGGGLFLTLLYGLALYLYFNIKSPLEFARKRLSSISYLQKHLPNSVLPVPHYHLWQVLVFSIIRYFAYLSLFVFLLKCLAPGVHTGLLYLYIPVVFFLQSGIPLPPAIAFMARVEFALLVLGGFDIDKISITTAGIWLWVLNLLLPSLVGLGLVLVKRTKKMK